MRVLHLISSRGFYGAERVAIELCSGLKDRGCHPVVGALQNTHNPHLEIIDEAKRNSIATTSFACKSRFDINLVFRLREFIKGHAIDLVHCHGYKSNFYGFLACGKKTPLVATNHNWLTSHWRLRCYRRLDSLWMRSFDRIIAVSEGVKKEMLNYGIPEAKIRIIDNGINMSRLQFPGDARTLRKEFGFHEEETIIGAIGNLAAVKGHAYLLRAARRLLRQEKVRLLIVGEGPLRSALEREAEQCGIREKVFFAGYRTDIPALLPMMDIFALPSENEGLPMVLLEAMAAKKPVIATRVGGVPRVVNDTTGMLVEPGDVDGLESAIEALLRDPEKRKIMAESGYQRVKTLFSSEQMSLQYYNVYRECLQ